MHPVVAAVAAVVSAVVVGGEVTADQGLLKMAVYVPSQSQCVVDAVAAEMNGNYRCWPELQWKVESRLFQVRKSPRWYSLALLNRFEASNSSQMEEGSMNDWRS